MAEEHFLGTQPETPPFDQNIAWLDKKLASQPDLLRSDKYLLTTGMK